MCYIELMVYYVGHTQLFLIEIIHRAGHFGDLLREWDVYGLWFTMCQFQMHMVLDSYMATRM